MSAVLPVSAPRYLGTPVLLLMAVACGMSVGGNYFNQPLLHSIATSLQISEATSAFTVTIAQVASALGLLLLVPLGDMLERRALVVILMLLAATGQFISGFATNIVMLYVGTLTAGLFSVSAQVLVPMAAALADPARSGRAVGIVMSGMLSGILVARSVAGLLSDLGGWTLVYRVAGVVTVLMALALWRSLPALRDRKRTTYGAILRSLGTLFIQQPRLRRRALLGGLSFASISVLFSTMALLLAGPKFNLSDAQIGLVGLAGVAGAMMANISGRLADRGWGQATAGTSAVLMVLSWAILLPGGGSLLWFLAGMLLIDLGAQGVHISNQNIVYKLVPEARSRLNAVYMTSYFTGGAAGSTLGSLAWQHWGWPGVCAVGAMLSIFVVVAWLKDVRSTE
jgi:predicted MFS family arabinose efflux permease